MLSCSPLPSRFRVLVCNSVTAVRFELLTAFTELFLKPLHTPQPRSNKSAPPLPPQMIVTQVVP
jgi:hypothetical protein